MERSRPKSVGRALADWVFVGCTGVEAGALIRTCVAATLGLLRAVLPQRVQVQRWIRYRVDLTAPLPPVSPEVRLTRVTDGLMNVLRQHPECAENQLRSGVRFWDRGLRRAYVWMSDEGPLCIQWLLTEADGARVQHLGDWAGMYPPLPRHTGQVENLFAFTTVRHKGVASRFEYALYQEARQLGLEQLVTHIHEPNTAARAWADRTGWQACGTITRYQVDVPGLRARCLYVHRNDAGAGSGKRSVPVPGGYRSPLPVPSRKATRHATIPHVIQAPAHPAAPAPH
jgi:hypothetical protein